MDELYELLKESVIFQGVLVIMVSGTTCWLYVSGQDVPSELLMIFSTVVGFFFGGKVPRTMMRVRKEMIDDLASGVR